MSHKRARGRGGEGGGRRGARGRRISARIVLLIIAILAAVILFQNTGQTNIQLLYREVTMPLWVALLGMGVIGVICGRFWGGRR